MGYEKQPIFGMESSSDRYPGGPSHCQTAKLKKKRPPPFPNKSRRYWETIIHDKFVHIKGERTWAQLQVMKSGQIEDGDEIENCRSQFTHRRLKRARIRERRVKKYEHRLTVAKGIVKLKEEAGEDNNEIWKWLGNIVRELGTEGMSSDESGAEIEIKMVYYTKVMAWRREVEKEL
ncbi:hypothetical protein JVT61DRAFT_6421 [Boletus reticuloceps]|uniref:Uncharacterized protein n=1 Tax=Boletus reticuloceps TaxID=495285 RepID=A0A8I2YJY7_9AGAM|nr:hypothetical protein JVT61DRAFT_6421 [Boletus reticuloceps]